MSPRTIRILAIAVVGLFATIWLFNREPTGGATTEELLFPGLKERLDEVTEVRVSDAESEVRVVRDGDRWVVPGKDGYAANTAVLRELLLGLAEARKIEQKTSNSELYDQLAVQDPQEEGASGVLVQSEGLDDADFSLILGDPVQREYRYARVAGEATSWLIDRNPDLPDETGGWLLSDIADIGSSRVQSVTIRHGDGETIRIHKESEGDANFAVEDLPEGRELSYPSVPNSIAAVLDNLTLEDVRRTGAGTAEGEAATATTVFTTFDGLEITVAATTKDDETWISLDAAALPRAAEGGDSGQAEDAGSAEANEAAGETGAPDGEDHPAVDAGSEGSSAGAASEDEAEAGDAASGEEAGEKPDPAAEAAEINARVAGWEYRIPEYKAGQLTRRWEDLLSEPESAGE